MNLESNSLFIQNEYRSIFFSILQKQFKYLHNFIGTVIQNETWIELENRIKNRIVKKIQDNDSKNIFIKYVEKIFKTRFLSEICQDNEKIKIIEFLKNKVCVSQLSSENLDEILSLSQLEKIYQKDPLQINFLDKKALNYFFLKGCDIEGTLNNIKMEELTDENLFPLLEIYKSNFRHSDSFYKTCSTYLKQKIGAQNIQLDNRDFNIQIEDLNLVNSDNLQKYILLYNNYNEKAKIYLSINRDDNYEDFIRKFNNNIYSIQFISNTFEELSSNIGKLTNLERLILKGCQNLTKLPEEIGLLTNLKLLDLSACSKLSTLPEKICFLKNLNILNLSKCSFSTLPPGIGKLTKLTNLELSESSISQLPAEINGLINLKTLNLSKCKKITTFPTQLGLLQNLNTLNLSETEITELPKEIEQLSLLSTLSLVKCSKLTKLCNFENLEKIDYFYFPLHLDNFTLTKIAFEKSKKKPHDTMRVIENIFPSKFTLKNIVLQIIRNLNFFEIDNFDFIYNWDLKKSDLSSFKTLLNFYCLFPKKRDEIHSLLFNKSDQLIIVDQFLIDDFINQNKELLKSHFEINNLEEYTAAVKLQIPINHNSILGSVLTNYFENLNDEFQENLVLTDEIMNFLQTPDGKKILVKYREIIFKKDKIVQKFIEKNFSSIKEKNVKFY